MNLNGKEFDFSIYNVDNAKKFEEESKRLAKDEQDALALLKEGKWGEGIQALYSTYKNFFINLTGTDVVGDLNDALKAQKLVVEFAGMIKPAKEITKANV